MGNYNLLIIMSILAIAGCRSLPERIDGCQSDPEWANEAELCEEYVLKREDRQARLKQLEVDKKNCKLPLIWVEGLSRFSGECKPAHMIPGLGPTTF